MGCLCWNVKVWEDVSDEDLTGLAAGILGKLKVSIQLMFVTISGISALEFYI